jgi:hypothetical protein
MRVPTILTFAAILGLLTGCSAYLENLTPAKVPENPSGIYTLSMQPRLLGQGVEPETMDASIVINGQKYPMDQNRYDPYLFEFDFVMPEDQGEAAFYYVLDYEKKMAGGTTQQDRISSELLSFELVNKYVLQLQVERAPVGRTVTVLGRRFFPSDQILVGGVPAQTTFETQNELKFVVPPLPAGESYPVQLRSGQDTVVVGSFRIDQSALRVAPGSLALVPGESAVLVFSVPFAAPEGGLPIPVSTDIPESIIMPEVVIPAGSRSVSVPVEGGQPGEGGLFTEAAGMTPVTIPVTVGEP